MRARCFALFSTTAGGGLQPQRILPERTAPSALTLALRACPSPTGGEGSLWNIASHHDLTPAPTDHATRSLAGDAEHYGRAITVCSIDSGESVLLRRRSQNPVATSSAGTAGLKTRKLRFNVAYGKARRR